MTAPRRPSAETAHETGHEEIHNALKCRETGKIEEELEGQIHAVNSTEGWKRFVWQLCILGCIAG